MIDDVIIYGWAEWPEHLLTKNQMRDAGYQIGNKLPAPVGKVRRSKSPGGWMYLYDRHDGVLKRPITQAQKEGLVKAQYMAQRLEYCPDCGIYNSKKPRTRAWWQKKKCPVCFAVHDAHITAVHWLSGDFVVLDLETTGLHDAGIVQIAVIDNHRNVLLDTLVKPDREISKGAQDIHGISAADVANAPSFKDVYHDLVAAISGKHLIIYNADYDWPIIRRSRIECGMGVINTDEISCAMALYARYCRKWDDYHRSFTWQKLPGGDHSAVGDCMATLDVIEMIASS